MPIRTEATINTDKFVKGLRVMTEETKKESAKQAKAAEEAAKKTTKSTSLLSRAFEQVGAKAKPGPLYGVSTHAWAARAVAIFTEDTINQGRRAIAA